MKQFQLWLLQPTDQAVSASPFEDRAPSIAIAQGGQGQKGDGTDLALTGTDDPHNTGASDRKHLHSTPPSILGAGWY